MLWSTGMNNTKEEIVPMSATNGGKTMTETLPKLILKREFSSLTGFTNKSKEIP